MAGVMEFAQWQRHDDRNGKHINPVGVLGAKMRVGALGLPCCLAGQRASPFWREMDGPM